MDLDFTCIECEITADVTVKLVAVLYDALRGFETLFRASCCSTGQQSCAFCAEAAECQYQTVFAQHVSSDPEIVRLHQKPSLPYSLHVNWPGANTVSVGIAIIGRAVNFVDLFHSALLRVVEAGVCAVLSPDAYVLNSYCIDYQGVRHLLNSSAIVPKSVIMLSGQHVLQNSVHSDRVRVSLLSPLRLLSNGSIAHRFDFGMFFRSQMRRCSSLYAYYGTGELNLDFVSLSRAAKNIDVLDDEIHYSQPLWSKRQNRSGLTGTAECAGLVEPMFSLLRLGSYFNAGKGAAIGLGYHKIEAA